MKKVVVILLAIASLQTITSQNLTFGVKSGVNYSKLKINFESPINYNYKIGYQIGGFAKIKLVNKLYIQPELLYSLQGTKFDTDLVVLLLPQRDNQVELLNVKDAKSNESSIIFPIMLKYHINDNFNVEIGPQVDYVFWVKGKNIEFLEGGLGLEEISNSVNYFNFGIYLGASYYITKKIGLNFRYNYGLNRSEPGSRLIDYLENAKQRNSVFQLNLEYRFN